MFAVVNDGIKQAGNPFQFSSVITAKGEAWSNLTDTFIIREATGIYLVALSAGVYNYSPGDFTLLLSGQRYAGITRTSRAHNHTDTIGRDVILPLYAEEFIQVSNAHAVLGYETSRETSISIFSISDSMVNETVAFSVARHTSTRSEIIDEPVIFDVILHNPAFHYDQLVHTFTAPTDGIYYFSFTVGLVSRGMADFVLQKNFEPFATIFRDSTTHSGTDTIGRSVMMELKENDKINIVNGFDLTARSSALKETSFSGFKYEPKHTSSVCYFIC